MIYILGSTGIISDSIRKSLNKKFKIISRQKKKNYIKTNIFNKSFSTKNEKCLKLISSRDTLIILSKPGSVYFCEKNPKKLKKFLNSITINLLSNININTKIIFISSDYIFCGKKKVYSDNSKARPINQYGFHKVYIENFIRKKFRNYLILRLPKIFSNNLKISSILSDSYSNLKKEQNLFYDHKCHFLNIIDFLNLFKKFLKKNISGTFNVPSKIYLSRFQFIDYFFKINKLNNSMLRKISIRDFKLFYVPKRIKMRTKLSLITNHLYLTKKENFIL